MHLHKQKNLCGAQIHSRIKFTSIKTSNLAHIFSKILKVQNIDTVDVHAMSTVTRLCISVLITLSSTTLLLALQIISCVTPVWVFIAQTRKWLKWHILYWFLIQGAAMVGKTQIYMLISQFFCWPLIDWSCISFMEIQQCKFLEVLKDSWYVTEGSGTSKISKMM